MATNRFTPEQLRAMEAALQADPHFRQVVEAAYPSESHRMTAINNYILNNPQSPASAALKAQQAGQAGQTRGRVTYRMNDQGEMEERGFGPQHWFTDPGVVGPLAVTAATLLGPAVFQGGPWPWQGNFWKGQSPSGSQTPLPSSTIPGAHTAVPGLPGVGRAVPPVAGGASTIESLIDKVLSPKGLLGVASAIPSLAKLFGGGNNSGPFGGDAAQLSGEVMKGLTSMRERFDATKPAFDTAQAMALGMAPTRYRKGPFGG